MAAWLAGFGIGTVFGGACGFLLCVLFMAEADHPTPTIGVYRPHDIDWNAEWQRIEAD